MKKHIPVMLSEVIKYLDIKKNGLYIDATLGEGGYSKAILESDMDMTKVLGIDATAHSLEKAKKNLSEFKKRIIFVHNNFKNIDSIAKENGFETVDGVVYDLGLATWQLEKSEEGIAFSCDQELDMRIFDENKYSAKEVLNRFSLKEIADILYKYADIRKSWAIARKIENYRRTHKITTTSELVEALGTKNPKYLAPVFQALRIYVNHELENLELSLIKSAQLLKNRGRLVVVSFHSGEDRITKNIFKILAKEKKYKILTKKPIVASWQEIKNNPKSRSAKLRAIERV